MGFHDKGIGWTGYGSSLAEQIGRVAQEDREKRRKAVIEQLALRQSSPHVRNMSGSVYGPGGSDFTRANAVRRAQAMTAEELKELLEKGETKVKGWRMDSSRGRHGRGKGGGKQEGEKKDPAVVTAAEPSGPTVQNIPDVAFDNQIEQDIEEQKLLDLRLRNMRESPGGFGGLIQQAPPRRLSPEDEQERDLFMRRQTLDPRYQRPRRGFWQ